MKKAKELASSLKGMHDILPEEERYYAHILGVARDIAEWYGFQTIALPHLEKTDLFEASVGEATDIVEKQMYSFHTKGGDAVTLRPEGTAPVTRAYLEHGMHTLPQPVKLFYSGAFFRHENPQAGRKREFYQAGLEIVGDTEPINDALVIRLFFLIARELGIPLTFALNSIGDQECRPAYRKDLTAYYRRHLARLCGDCRRRFKINPFRLLDCKEETCRAIRERAPKMIERLCEPCKRHFDEVKEFLDAVHVPYEIDPFLVRGLDYYTRTVFESFVSDHESADFALASGGRYDGLAKALGSSREVNAVGGAMGVDRFVEIMHAREARDKKVLIKKEMPLVFVIQLGQTAKKKLFGWIEEFRRAGLPVVHSLSRDSLKAQLKLADRMNTPWTVMVGQKEALDGTAIIRDMISGEQETVPLTKLVFVLKGKIKKK
ncbi:MAG: histidine--tRNA ligase [Patescibacteria group bacterium]